VRKIPVKGKADKTRMDQHSVTVIDKAKRNRKTLSKALQVAIYRRDGWLCCWCKKLVIFSSAMRLMEVEVQNALPTARLAYYHSNWSRAGSPLLDELGAPVDHVQAFSTGGACREENLCTSCWKCNVRKNSAGVDQWEQRQKHNPVKGKYGEPRDWDGLASVFVMLAERHPTLLTAGEREWLKAMQSNDSNSAGSGSYHLTIAGQVVI
jgi:5-methylcytosine-specific restriction endonuclease McrA